MMEEQEEEEFITVRVQDPRIQDQSSWSSYVDYNIFLYTNSKAFTVKTSCVRRRYREFVWLRRRLQKNAGLVPLPELPGKKPFFQVNDSEGIERRRQGLQQFLEKLQGKPGELATRSHATSETCDCCSLECCQHFSTSFGTCGRKPEHPEETHSDTGGTCRLRTQ
ncbi:sorting nexin-11-like isoform X2 [Scyliorhinus canicula]|uniref:sorting nexin-11-like isoform X2 n=1 Tax=Scyliorhinus canicula TaxID=7830 RepID=UPI0018F79766|nr:sorting nexin-11-like isoform X2 [Scyliorhinus canicula]